MVEEKYFLVQVKHTNNVWEKGVVIKNTLVRARQSYHAYLDAYGYEHDSQTDYVAVQIFSDNGGTYDMTIDDRRSPPNTQEE